MAGGENSVVVRIGTSTALISSSSTKTTVRRPPWVNAANSYAVASIRVTGLGIPEGIEGFTPAKRQRRPETVAINLRQLISAMERISMVEVYSQYGCCRINMRIT
jgi:hypothetical protein